MPKSADHGLDQALFFRVNTDALKYPRAPGQALTTASEVQLFKTELATKIAGDMKRYDAKPRSKKKKCPGKKSAAHQQKQAKSSPEALQFLRNPATVRSAADLVREGGIVAAVLAIEAKIEPPLAWSSPV